MEVGKLLYVTDIKQPKFSEIERLMDLRTLGLEEVILLHATDVGGWAARLGHYEARLGRYGMNLKTLMLDGPLVSCVLGAVRRETVPLIAASLNTDIGTRRRRSLTKDLLRSSPVPVIILPQDVNASGSGEQAVFRHVIFATDWLPSSEKAMRYLLNFADIVKELEIVHVIDKKPSVRDMRNLKKKLAESREIFLDHGIDAEGHIYAGKPPDEIMLAARNYNATCVVMGTTGKSRVKELLFHSCSCRVADGSGVPTVIVP